MSIFRVFCRKELDGWTDIAKHGSDRSYVYCGSLSFWFCQRASISDLHNNSGKEEVGLSLLNFLRSQNIMSVSY